MLVSDVLCAGKMCKVLTIYRQANKIRANLQLWVCFTVLFSIRKPGSGSAILIFNSIRYLFLNFLENFRYKGHDIYDEGLCIYWRANRSPMIQQYSDVSLTPLFYNFPVNLLSSHRNTYILSYSFSPQRPRPGRPSRRQGRDLGILLAPAPLCRPVALVYVRRGQGGPSRPTVRDRMHCHPALRWSREIRSGRVPIQRRMLRIRQ